MQKELNELINSPITMESFDLCDSFSDYGDIGLYDLEEQYNVWINLIKRLEYLRTRYNETKDEHYLDELLKMLPSAYEGNNKPFGSVKGDALYCGNNAYHFLMKSDNTVKAGDFYYHRFHDKMIPLYYNELLKDDVIMAFYECGEWENLPTMDLFKENVSVNKITEFLSNIRRKELNCMVMNYE